MDARDAVCTLPADLSRIARVIQNGVPGGYDGLNALLRTALLLPLPRAAQRAARLVRLHILRHARIKTVGKS